MASATPARPLGAPETSTGLFYVDTGEAVLRTAPEAGWRLPHGVALAVPSVVGLAGV